MPIPAGWKAEENAAVAEKTLEGWTPEAPQQRGDFLPADIPTYMRFKYYTDRASSEYSEVMNEAMMGRMDPNIALTKAKDVRITGWPRLVRIRTWS